MLAIQYLSICQFLTLNGIYPALYSFYSFIFSRIRLPLSLFSPLTCAPLHAAIVCDKVLPALIGLVWALRSTPQERTEKLRTVFTLSYEDSGQLQLSFKEFIKLRGHRLVNIPQEGEKGEKKNDFLSSFVQRINFDEKCVMTLYHTVRARMVCTVSSLCIICI